MINIYYYNIDFLKCYINILYTALFKISLKYRLNILYNFYDKYK